MNLIKKILKEASESNIIIYYKGGDLEEENNEEFFIFLTEINNNILPTNNRIIWRNSIGIYPFFLNKTVFSSQDEYPIFQLHFYNENLYEIKTEKEYNYLLETDFATVSNSGYTFFKGPNGDIFFDKREIKEIKKIKKIKTISTNKLTISKNAKKSLLNFLNNYGQDIPEIFWDEFKNFIPEKKIKIFRGMSWEKENLSKFNLNVKTGNYINLKEKRATSWSTNENIAQGFVNDVGGEYSVILEFTAVPEQIIIDTRKINKEQREDLFPINQEEVILKPIKFKAKIKHLFYNKKLVNNWEI